MQFKEGKRVTLIFEVDGEYDHAGLYFLQHIGIFEVGIPLVDIAQPVTDFDFG